jgi:hypothetical protein
MVTSLRLLGLSLLALFVSAGLIGCAVFSAGASTPAEPAPAMPAMEHHEHDHAHHMASDEPAPAHDHGSEDCEGCARSLLNRISIAPDLAPVFEKLPAPVFVIPAALQFDAEKDIPERAEWPPGDEPPICPDTLTHQKISLLI